MEELIYRVAGHTFKIKSAYRQNLKEILLPYSDFADDVSCEKPIFQLDIVDNPLEKCEEQIETFSMDGGKGFVCSDGKNFSLDIYVDASKKIYRMRCSYDFTNAFLYIDKATKRNDMFFVLNNCLMFLYAFSSARYSTLLVHSSVIIKDNAAYLFLGKSGTGKSTHTRLWRENIKDAYLLNDDNPVLRFVDGRAIVYGTPWSGKTQCYKNESCHVGGITRLRQKPFNDIFRMKPVEAYASLVSSCSIIRSVPEINEYVNDTVASIVSVVPLYLLDCLPDADAAMLSYKMLSRNDGNKKTES